MYVPPSPPFCVPPSPPLSPLGPRCPFMSLFLMEFYHKCVPVVSHCTLSFSRHRWMFKIYLAAKGTCLRCLRFCSLATSASSVNVNRNDQPSITLIVSQSQCE